jgi:rsbT co-antagonist protein RsbR
MTVAPLWLWAVDREGRFTMSEGRLAFFGVEGVEPGALIGTSALDVFKGHHPEVVAALGRALGGQDSRTVTSPSPGVQVETWYVPLRDAEGGLRGAAGIAIDASDRLRTERELREKLEVIERQSSTIRALATPVIQVWDQVLCLPVIGIVDSARTAEMMQGLLESIVREQARYAIVDLTGVEVVDTSTADHLIQLFRAARVLGVEGILCGIRPAVAQTVVALGLELGSVKTMRSLRDALKWCIRARGEDPAGARSSAVRSPARL